MSLVTCHMPHVMCHVSRLTCYVSHVMCHMSRVICHVSHVTCLQQGEAHLLRVCYQRGLLRLFLAEPVEARGCSTNTFVIN